ncbi:hypothetical protein KC330_g5232, partial [Hortaea werneckii]
MPATPQTIFVGVIGVGGVGKAFLGQLQHLTQRLSQANPPTDLRLILARRSTKQIFSESWQALNISTLLRDLDQVTQPLLPLQETLDYLATAPGKVVLVDNTSDPTLANSYPTIVRKGISLVTPNKKAFSDTYALWSDIFS